MREAVRVRDEDTSIRVWFPRFGNTACGREMIFKAIVTDALTTRFPTKRNTFLRQNQLTFAASVTVRLACSNLSGTSRVPLSKHCK